MVFKNNCYVDLILKRAKSNIFNFQWLYTVWFDDRKVDKMYENEQKYRQNKQK